MLLSKISLGMMYFKNFRYRIYMAICFAIAVILIYLMIPYQKQQENAQTRVLQWKLNGWEQQKHFCTGSFNFEKIQLKTPAGTTPMFIHPFKKDIFISRDLKRSGTWETPNLNLFKNMLEKYPEAGAIDIGSQLGTYALFAAKMGRTVIAVDPLEQNILRFCKSVQEGYLTERVTIFFAAVSSSHKKVSFRGDPMNIGKTWIEEVPSGSATVAGYSKFISDTSLLNDMLEEMHFKKTIMKIDVEGHEYHVLKAADKIFKNIDVRGIIMEWVHVKTTPGDAEKLMYMLIGYGLIPMDMERNALSLEMFKSWPNDIVWEKK